MSSGVQKRLTKMVYDLKRRKLSGALTVALETTEVLSIAIASTGKPTAKAMMVSSCGSHTRALGMPLTAARQDAVTHVGQQLIFASPLDLTIGNVVRRVLFIIREQLRCPLVRALAMAGWLTMHGLADTRRPRPTSNPKRKSASYIAVLRDLSISLTRRCCLGRRRRSAAATLCWWPASV